jgi:putative tryptophan/tyrosine transport system substrate-binding protein
LALLQKNEIMGGNERREFITLLVGAAVACPLAVRAQPSDQLRRIGVIYGLAETDLEARAWDASFRKRLAGLGWTDGRNVRIADRLPQSANARGYWELGRK